MRVWAKRIAANLEDGSERQDWRKMSEVKTSEHGECGRKVKDDSKIFFTPGTGWLVIHPPKVRPEQVLLEGEDNEFRLGRVKFWLLRGIVSRCGQKVLETCPELSLEDWEPVA